MSSFPGFEYPTGREALTIPGSFMQQVVAHENLSTIRVVGYMLTKTLKGQPVIEASYEDLRKALNLSRCAVHEGLKHALETGYIRLIQAGENGHTRARYALNWQDEVVGPGSANEPLDGEKKELTSNITFEPDLAGFKTEVQVENQIAATISRSENQFSCHDSKRLESNRIEQVESYPLPVRKAVKRQTAFHNTTVEPASGELPILNISSYLTNLSRDFSRELGDESHTSSNRSQTMNLWHKSKLSEKDFARLMYRARELTRRYAVLRPGEKEPAPGQLRNRMAYFFTVLRHLLEEREPQMQSNLASGYALVDLPQPGAVTTTATPPLTAPSTVTNTRQAERTRLHESWKRYLNRPLVQFEEEEVAAAAEGIRRYV